jgi:hypothetical protein
MIGFYKQVRETKLKKLEPGDYVVVKTRSESYSVRLTGITISGNIDDDNRVNVMFGTVVGNPGAMIQIDLISGIMYFFGPDSHFSNLIASLTTDGGEELKYDNCTIPCRTQTVSKQVIAPVAVGDVLTKASRSGQFKVVYVNNSVSSIVVEKEDSGKIEVINFRDKCALDSFGLHWK